MVKTKRKLLSAIIAAFGLTLLLGGCGGSGAGPDDTGSNTDGSADTGSETVATTGGSDE